MRSTPIDARNPCQDRSEAPDTDFGRYLSSVAERDIDLLLMEEFHISDDFVGWFCGELGLHGVSYAGAWHSLSDADGESDLFLRVLKEDRRIGIFMENKIAAPEQELQGERYHLRGVTGNTFGSDTRVSRWLARKVAAASPTGSF